MEKKKPREPGGDSRGNKLRLGGNRTRRGSDDGECEKGEIHIHRLRGAPTQEVHGEFRLNSQRAFRKL
jgi:hypothetical protein